MEIVCSAQHHCHWWERQVTATSVCRMMEAIELHINARYYAQHSVLKLVYGKSQSVIGGKLFFSCRTVFEVAQEYSDSKTNDFNNCSSNEALV